MYFFLRFIFIVVISAASLFVVASDDNLKLTGDFMQGGLVYGQVTPGSKVQINGHWVRVSADGEFILGFGRDYPAQTALAVYSADGTKELHTLEIAPREYNIQRINGLPDKQVNPSEGALVQIRKESADISRARRQNDDRMDFKSGFIWPAQGPISGVYGSQRVLNRQARRPHFGIDIAAPTGTSVVAPAAGIVTYVNDNMYFSGGTLVVDHGQNLSSSFLHLHKILVKVGARVEQGQKIALVGATGRVTGAHLDWRMNWHRQRLDPGLIMGAMPTQK